MQLFTGNFVLNARFDRCNKLEIGPAPFLPPSACFDSKDETVKTAIEFSVIKIFGALNSGETWREMIAEYFMKLPLSEIGFIQQN